MNKYGNIPEEVLYTEFRDIDEDPASLKDLIDFCLEDDEFIIDAKWHMSMSHEQEAYLESFTAWTENNVLMLIINGTLGAYLAKVKRNPQW